MVVGHTHENRSLVVGQVDRLLGEVVMVVVAGGDCTLDGSIVHVADIADAVGACRAVDSAVVDTSDALARGIVQKSVVDGSVALVDENLDPDSGGPEMDIVGFVARVEYFEALAWTADLHCADLGTDCGPGIVA